MSMNDAARITLELHGVDKASGTFKSVSKSILSMAAGFALSVGAIDKVGDAIKYSIQQAADGEREQAALNAVIESTGGVAGMTAEELNKMALSLSRVSTFSDGAINESQALLLTFTKIGEDVFPQAQQAILDVATLMGGDLKSATIQVGKALNDPIAGLSALSRVGIQFSEEQKNTIKTMMEMGDVAGAQGVILGELSTQFGGQAAAAANTYHGEIQQLRNEMEILGETVGNDLLPSIREFTGSAKDAIQWTVANYEAIKKWGDTALKVLNIGYLLSDVINDGRKANKEYTESVEENRDVLEDMYEKKRHYTDWEIAAAQAVSDSKNAMSDQSDVIDSELIPSYEDLEKELAKVEEAYQKSNKVLIDGAIDITSSQKDYQAEQDDIIKQIQETRAEGEKLYPWEAEKIDENKQKLEDLGNQYFENRDKFREAMEERLAMMAVEQIALSDGVAGFSEAEYEKARVILETQDIATAAAFEEQQAMTTLSQAVADGTIPVENWGAILDQVMADGVIQVGEVQAAIEAVPKQNTITFDIITNGAPPNLDTSTEAATAPKGTHRRSNADGGTYLIPSAWGNEGFPLGNSDTASAGELITITPKGQQGGITRQDLNEIVSAILQTRMDEYQLGRIVKENMLQVVK